MDNKPFRGTAMKRIEAEHGILLDEVQGL